MGKFFAILGPSGVGKGTLISIIKKKFPNFIFPISVTTRAPRKNEKNGENYYFFSEKKFLQYLQKDKFLEFAQVHQKYFYGTLKSEILPHLSAGKNVIREVDVQGFEQISKKISAGNLVSVFLLPPNNNSEILKKRILARAKISPQELENRLKSLEKEMPVAEKCDFKIKTVDGNKKFAFEEFKKILQRLEIKK